jgi:hypothetical protein
MANIFRFTLPILAAFLFMSLFTAPCAHAQTQEEPVIEISVGKECCIVCKCIPSDLGPEDRVTTIHFLINGAHEALELGLHIGGTATNGVDYETLQDTFPISGHDDSQWYRYPMHVTALDDLIAEGNETVVITLLDGEGYKVTETEQYQVTIVIFDDDEEPSEFQINAGLNDAWLIPAVNDQGFIITVYPDAEIMFVSWFTYELLPRVAAPDGDSSLGDDKQRWLIAQGPYAGSVAELDVIATIEGGFGKKKAGRKPIGTMVMTFDNCNDGDVTYSVTTDDENTVSGTSHIERIVPDNIPHCEELDAQLREGG